MLTDVEMPGMTGLELLQALRRASPDLNVAVLTSHASLDNAVRALRDRADEFLQKSMPPDQLLASGFSDIVYDFATLDFDTPGKRHYRLAFHLDSAWGYSLVPITVIRGASPGPTGVAVIGGTHGNEYEGQVAVKRLCQSVGADDVRGLLILMPQLSESACRAGTRVSPLDGVNMNRAFPGNAGGSISYRIAHFVKTAVFPRVRVVVDIHSGRPRSCVPPLHFLS